MTKYSAVKSLSWVEKFIWIAWVCVFREDGPDCNLVLFIYLLLLVPQHAGSWNIQLSPWRWIIHLYYINNYYLSSPRSYFEPCHFRWSPCVRRGGSQRSGSTSDFKTMSSDEHHAAGALSLQAGWNLFWCHQAAFLAPLLEVTRKVLKSLLLLKNLPIYELWPQHVATGTGLKLRTEDVDWQWRKGEKVPKISHT